MGRKGKREEERVKKGRWGRGKGLERKREKGKKAEIQSF